MASSEPALAYANRLSDFLFVAARRANGNGAPRRAPMEFPALPNR